MLQGNSETGNDMSMGQPETIAKPCLNSALKQNRGHETRQDMENSSLQTATMPITAQSVQQQERRSEPRKTFRSLDDIRSGMRTKLEQKMQFYQSAIRANTTHR